MSTICIRNMITPSGRDPKFGVDDPRSGFAGRALLVLCSVRAGFDRSQAPSWHSSTRRYKRVLHIRCEPCQHTQTVHIPRVALFTDSTGFLDALDDDSVGRPSCSAAFQPSSEIPVFGSKARRTTAPSRCQNPTCAVSSRTPTGHQHARGSCVEVDGRFRQAGSPSRGYAGGQDAYPTMVMQDGRT